MFIGTLITHAPVTQVLWLNYNFISLYHQPKTVAERYRQISVFIVNKRQHNYKKEKKSYRYLKYVTCFSKLKGYSY